MDELWMMIQPPMEEPMYPMLPGDPYFPEYPTGYQPIHPTDHALMQYDEIEPEEEMEEEPEEELEEDPEEEMEEKHEQDPEEDMDDDDENEVIMITDSESSTSPPPTPNRCFLGVSFCCPRKTARILVPDWKLVSMKYKRRSSHTQERIDQPSRESYQGNQ